jgi:hypothetical protein
MGPEQINPNPTTFLSHNEERKCEKLWTLPDAQHFAAIFMAEAKATRPNGSSMVGPEEISASHARSYERFESSQHLVAGHDISVSGNRATARANLVAMHMWQGSNTNANNADNFFIAGGVIDVTLVRADGQWKIS